MSRSLHKVVVLIRDEISVLDSDVAPITGLFDGARLTRALVEATEFGSPRSRAD